MKKIIYALTCLLLVSLFSNKANAETIIGDKTVSAGENWVISEDTAISGDLVINYNGSVEIADGYTLTVIGAVKNFGALRIGSNNASSSETNYAKLVIEPQAGNPSDAYLVNDDRGNVYVGYYSVLNIDGDLKVKNGSVSCGNLTKTTVTGDIVIDSSATYVKIDSTSSSSTTLLTLGGDLIDPHGKFKVSGGGRLCFSFGKSHSIETGHDTVLGNVSCDFSMPILVKNYLYVNDLVTDAYFKAADSSPINLIRLNTQDFSCKIEGNVVHSDSDNIAVGKDSYGTDVGEGSSTLDITGDLIVENGNISTQGNDASKGILNQVIVGGDLRIQKVSGEDFIKGAGKISSHGTITVKGSFYNNSSATSYLYGNAEGRMNIFGDYYDISGNISSNGSDVLYFETNELNHNHILDIETKTMLGKIGCASGETITVEDYFYCKGLVSDIKIIAKNDAILANYLATDTYVCDVTGDVIMPNETSSSPNIKVGENALGKQYGKGSGLLKISGMLVAEKGMISIAGSNSELGISNLLQVDGDLRIQGRSGDDYIKGSGQFNLAYGSIVIKGNLYINSSTKSYFGGGGEGEMTLYGDYFDYSGNSDATTYTAYGTYVTSFAANSSHKHTISMPATSNMGILKVADGEELIIDDYLNIKELGSDVTLSAENYPIKLVNLATNEYECVINGDVVSSQLLKSSGLLTIAGSLIKEGGNLESGSNGRISIRDDLRIQKVDAEGKYVQGAGWIVNFNGELEVGKNLYVNTSKSSMTFGLYAELILHGDLYDDSASFIPYDKGGILKFTEGKHDIYATYVSDSRSTTFFDIEGDNVTLNWKNADAPFLFYYISNGAKIAFEGDAVISQLKGRSDYSKIIEGSHVTFQNNLVQKSGRLQLEDSDTTLNVLGDYILRTPGSSGEYQKSTGTFVMNAYTIFNLDGNCEIQTNGSFSLNGGKWTAKGNIYQYIDDSATGKITGSSKHTTVLPGYSTGKQIIKLDNTASKFGVVNLVQTRDHYSFTPDNCWYSIDEPEAAHEYSIEYVLNGGSNHSDNPVTFTDETATIILKDASRKGYNFKGWYADDAYLQPVMQIDEGTTENITLYAKWEIINYSISYVLNGGTNTSSNPTKYNIGSANILLKSASRKGYSFDGWYSNKELTQKVTEIKSGTIGNKTFYAKWKLNTYSITYNLNSGKNSSKNPKTYTIKSDTIVLQKATRKGYTFVGWYKNKKMTSKLTQIQSGSTGNITLYAKWSANTYTIKFNANGGKGTVKSQKATYDKKIKLNLNKFKKTGYKFIGWSTSKKQANKGKVTYKNGVSVKNLTDKNKSTVTLYAVWKKK